MSVILCTDKKYLAAAGCEEVKLYDIRSQNTSPFLSFTGHTGNVTGVAFHCEGKWMVTSSEDGTVKVWDTRTATVQRNYHHGNPVNDVVIHPNQGELISCDRAGNVRIWDLGENKCTHQLIPEEDVSVSSVTVATDGTLLCAGNNAGNVYVWRMYQTGEKTEIMPVCYFQAHNAYITRVLLSPDVRKLATCSSDHNARIWSVELNNTSNPPSSKSSSISGKDSSSGGEKEQPIATFPLESTLSAHQRWVWDCAFSADSAYLVTACSDHCARLWELETQNIIRQYLGHHKGAVCVALNDYSDTR
ncbi:TOR complex subunit lst8 [Agyrium rufum]|nr:TOR complex subunit lst8 [Agyrium rufum]